MTRRRIVALVVLAGLGVLIALRIPKPRRGAPLFDVHVTGTVRFADGRAAIGASVGTYLELGDQSAEPTIGGKSTAMTDDCGRFTQKATAARRQVLLAAVLGRYVGLASVDVDDAEKDCRLDLTLEVPPAIDLILRFSEELEDVESKVYLVWMNDIGREVASQSVLKPRGRKSLKVPNRMPAGRYGLEIRSPYIEWETRSGVVIDRRDVVIDAQISKWGTIVGRKAPELRIAGWHRAGDAVNSIRDLRGKWVLIECWAFE